MSVFLGVSCFITSEKETIADVWSIYHYFKGF